MSNYDWPGKHKKVKRRSYSTGGPNRGHKFRITSGQIIQAAARDLFDFGEITDRFWELITKARQFGMLKMSDAEVHAFLEENWRFIESREDNLQEEGGDIPKGRRFPDDPRAGGPVWSQ